MRDSGSRVLSPAPRFRKRRLFIRESHSWLLSREVIYKRVRLLGSMQGGYNERVRLPGFEKKRLYMRELGS